MVVDDLLDRERIQLRRSQALLQQDPERSHVQAVRDGSFGFVSYLQLHHASLDAPRAFLLQSGPQAERRDVDAPELGLRQNALQEEADLPDPEPIVANVSLFSCFNTDRRLLLEPTAHGA